MSRIRWNKILRDLWKNKTKTILVVLAIAVGLFAFGSVFIVEDVMVSDMTSEFTGSRPANVIISMSPFDDALVRWVKRQPGVDDAQGRATYMVKLIGKDSRTYNLTLIAFDNYTDINLNKLTPETGVFPPGRDQLIMERASLECAGQVGDRATIEMPNGQRYSLDIAGTVHDVAALPASMFPMPTGYVSTRTLHNLDLPINYSQLNIVAAPEYRELADFEKLGNTIRLSLRDRGFDIYTVRAQRPDEHWAKAIFESFTLILSGVGIFSLVLSGFLVINTITALLAQQRRQIGVMKAIGGSARQITGIYLTLVAFYGFLALFVALPVSLGIAYLFCGQIAYYLNLNIQGFGIPARVLYLEAGAALIVPIVAALVPVLGGVRVSIRKTLSNYGVIYVGNSLFDRLLIRIRGLPRPILLSLRNTFRCKGRLLMTLGTLTLAGTLFISVMNVKDALVAGEADLFKDFFAFDVQISFDGTYKARALEDRAHLIPGVAAAEARIGSSMQINKEDGTKGQSFDIIGVPVNSIFTHPKMNTGRWLNDNDENTMVISSGLMDKLTGVAVGDTITLWMGDKKRDWKIAGVFPDPYDLLSYANYDYLSRTLGRDGLASQIYIAKDPHDPVSQEALGARLEQSYKDSGIKVVATMTRDTIASSWSGRDAFTINFLMSMAAMAAVIGGLGLMGLMSLNVLERTREIGVMRSIGASSASVGGIVLVEGLIIGALSWILAIPVSVPISLAFNTAMGNLMVGKPLSFIFSPAGLYLWGGTVTFIAVAASLLPAYRAMKMSIRETLAYE